MTVRELIDQLEKLAPDMLVLAADDQCGDVYRATRVELTTFRDEHEKRGSPGVPAVMVSIG